MTQEPQPSRAMTDLMTFDLFDAGETTIAPAAHELTHDAAGVPLINGVPAGIVVGAIVEVRVKQLRLAPAPDLLYPRYDPTLDTHLANYSEAVEAMGDMVPALLVQPANETITINGELLPVYLVYHDPVLFAALINLKRTRIRVEIPTVKNPGAILLLALSRQQHLRIPSLLDLADVVRRLSEDYRYSPIEIARSLRRDSSEKEDTTYISRLCSIAHLPELVRGLIDRGLLSYTHARELAGRFGSDPVRATQVARLTVQQEMNVNQMVSVINALAPLSGRPTARIDDDGQRLKLIMPPPEPQFRLVSDRPSISRLPSYGNYILARPARIQSQCKQHPASTAIIPHPSLDRVAVTPEYVQGLARELAAVTSAMPVREYEELLLGRLEAVRQAMAEQKLLNEIGTTAPIVDAQDQQA